MANFCRGMYRAPYYPGTLTLVLLSHMLECHLMDGARKRGTGSRSSLKFCYSDLMFFNEHEEKATHYHTDLVEGLNILSHMDHIIILLLYYFHAGFSFNYRKCDTTSVSCFLNITDFT